MGPVEAQIEAVRTLFPEASAVSRGDGTVLVTIPGVPLPAGWSARTTTAYFLAPAGYPMAQPDCFWADATLRLASGAMPQASGLTPIPGESEPRLWFSWHLTSGWNPVRDTLLSYVRTIQGRFARGN
jgi:hypothetical protein